MEKILNLAAIMAMAAQLATAAIVPANGLAVLKEIAAHQQLMVDGIVCEAWIPEPSYRAAKALMNALAIDGVPASGEYALSEGTTAKVCYDSEQLIVQVVTTSASEGEYYYQKLYRWMACFGQGRPVGATVLAQIPEAMEADKCQALVADAMSQLPAQLRGSMQEGRMISSAYYVPGVAPVLKIAGQPVNINMACVRETDRTRLYLGTPVIYQQY